MLERYDCFDGGMDVHKDGDYVLYEDIEPYLELLKLVKEYGFIKEGTEAGANIAEAINKIENA